MKRLNNLTLMKFFLMIILSFAFVIGKLYSQDNRAKATISGVIKDYSTKEPLIGANIVVMNTNLGAATNLKGKFELVLPAGIYDLKISMVGYEELILPKLIVKKNIITFIDTTLTEKIIDLETVVITPKTDRYDATGLSAKLDRNMIKRSPGSAQDVFWTLQTLPGVSSGSDDSKLYVRGGSSTENLILFDGATLSNPYHFEFMGGGLFSIFNSRLIESVKFYAGGYPARYGDRLSSVLVVKNKIADKEKFDGELNLSLTDVNGIIEFPFKGLNGSGLFSVRRSYFDLVYKLIPDLKNQSEAIPYFIDSFGKLDFSLSDFGSLAFTALTSFENLYGEFNYDHFSGKMNSDGYNQSFAAKLSLILSDNIVNELDLYYSKSDKQAQYPMASVENYKFIEYGIKNDLTLFYKNHEVHLGGWIVFRNDNVSVFIPGEINFYTLEDYMMFAKGNYNLYSLYGEDKIKITNDVSINAGLRFDYSDQLRKGVLSPRLNLAYAWNEHMNLSFDYGWYYQSPMAYETAVNPALEFRKSESIGIGIKHQVSDQVEASVELYNKKLSKLVTYNSADASLLSDGFGFAKGIELYLQIKPSDKLFGWISYSYSVAKRKEGIIRSEQYFSFDRTHLLSAVANYSFSEAWTIGTKYRFGTGIPYTPVAGGYFDQSQNKYFPILGEQNSARYPSYNRFDVRLTRRIDISNYPLDLYIEILNLFNNSNIVHWIYNTNYTSRDQMTVFPLIPVIGINWKM